MWGQMGMRSRTTAIISTHRHTPQGATPWPRCGIGANFSTSTPREGCKDQGGQGEGNHGGRRGGGRQWRNCGGVHPTWSSGPLYQDRDGVLATTPRWRSQICLVYGAARGRSSSNMEPIFINLRKETSPPPNKESVCSPKLEDMW